MLMIYYMLCSGVQASDQGVVLQAFRSEVSLLQTGPVSVLWKELNTENKMKKKSSFQDENYFSNFSSAPHYCNQTLETWESHQLCTFAIIFPWWNEIVIDIRPNLFLLFHDYYLLLFIPTLSMHIVIWYLKVKAFK